MEAHSTLLKIVAAKKTESGTLDVNDLNLLISVLKRREENIIQLLDYNLKYKDSILSEELKLLSTLQDEVAKNEKEREKFENQLIQKYASVRIQDEKQKKLVGKLSGKLIQLNRSVISKLNELKLFERFKMLYDGFDNMEKELDVMINKGIIDLDTLFITIISGFRAKTNHEEFKKCLKFPNKNDKSYTLPTLGKNNLTNKFEEPILKRIDLNKGRDHTITSESTKEATPKPSCLTSREVNSSAQGNKSILNDTNEINPFSVSHSDTDALKKLPATSEQTRKLIVNRSSEEISEVRSNRNSQLNYFKAYDILKIENRIIVPSKKEAKIALLDKLYSEMLVLNQEVKQTIVAYQTSHKNYQIRRSKSMTNEMLAPHTNPIQKKDEKALESYSSLFYNNMKVKTNPYMSSYRSQSCNQNMTQTRFLSKNIENQKNISLPKLCIFENGSSSARNFTDFRSTRTIYTSKVN